MEIQETTSFEQLQAFLKEKSPLIKDEDYNFMHSLTKAWLKKNLSKKLIEFHEEELAKKIDAINPNQSKCDICKDIYTVILKETNGIFSTSDESHDYQIGESMINDIEWSVYL